MATPTREEQENSFAKQLYDAARVAGFAAQEQRAWILKVRFEDKDGDGIGTEILCASSLDWKTLHHVALYVGSRAEGRSLFSLALQSEHGGSDALFSGEQFDDFKAGCTAKLNTAEALGLNEARAVVWRRCGPVSPPLPPLQVLIVFRLRKLAGAGDVTAANNVDAGRKRLHYGTVRQPYFPPSDPLPQWFRAGRRVA
jgi:hypothetical protein